MPQAPARSGGVARRDPAFWPEMNLRSFRVKLLRWYDENRRDLPWRQTRDPYRIWLSEVMLQQTRVAAVIDHYHAFLGRFPDIEALAAASLDSVVAAWSGLGYYRRARFMHRCAQQIATQYGGTFPRESNSLLSLPGVGRYTASAVASIAFSEATAVVDGNVERVLRRLLGGALSGEQNWQLAKSLLDRSRPGDFNQAMMELGAVVCLPREPQCVVCPVRAYCSTRGEGERTIPAKLKLKKETWHSLVCRVADEGLAKGKRQVWLVRRSDENSLMAAMWELPKISRPKRTSPGKWRTFRHSITVTDYTVHVVKSVALDDEREAGLGEWIDSDRIQETPITGLTRKILKADGVI